MKTRGTLATFLFLFLTLLLCASEAANLEKRIIAGRLSNKKGRSPFSLKDSVQYAVQ